jgi:uncharacterized membrane protein
MGASIGFVVAVWALNFIAAKIGLRYLPAVTMASFRVTIAGLTMIPAYLICVRLPAFADARRARMQGLSRRDLWTFFYLGFFGVVVNQMCFTMGLRYTSVSHAAVIVGMGPIYTLVLAVLFRLEAGDVAQGGGHGHRFCGGGGAGVGERDFAALAVSAGGCNYHDRVAGLCDLCSAGEASGREV